jgi:proteic killer suppression protein
MNRHLFYIESIDYAYYLNSLTIIMDAVIIQHMIKTFKSAGTEDVFDGIASRAARKCCPQSIWPVARRKLDLINRVREVNELKVPPGNRLERLKGDRESQYSIRINQQYRICFTWEEGHAYEIEITDYH